MSMSPRNEEIAMGEGDFQKNYLKNKFLPRANVLHFTPSHPYLSWDTHTLTVPV